MMDSREWAALFGNPRFMPRPEVMRTRGVDLVPARSRQEFAQEPVRAEIDELRRSVAAIGNVVSELCSRLASTVPVVAESPAGADVADGTTPEEGSVGDSEEEEKDKRELELVPVDSVVYSIEEDKDKDKQKKGLFGRKTK